MLDRNSDISRTFAWLQIPMAVAIAFFHSMPPAWQVEGYTPVPAAMVRDVIAVSLYVYALISGYLLMAGRKRFTPSDYLRLLHRKGRTLLLPYLIWLTIGAVFTIWVIDIYHEDPAEYTLKVIYWAWNYHTPGHSLLGYEFWTAGLPAADPPLWFLRDIMVMMLLSPVVWLICRLPARLSLPLITAAILLNAGVPWLGSNLPLFFCLGAVSARHGIDLAAFSRRMLLPALVLYAACGAGFTWMQHFYAPKYLLHSSLAAAWRQSMILAGAITFLGAACACINSPRPAAVKISDFLVRYAPFGFFLYIVHQIIVLQQFPAIYRFITSRPDMSGAVTLAITFGLRMVIVTALYVALCRFPRLYSLLTGGRAGRTRRHTHTAHADAEKPM